MGVPKSMMRKKGKEDKKNMAELSSAHRHSSLFASNVVIIKK